MSELLKHDPVKLLPLEELINVSVLAGKLLDKFSFMGKI